MMKERLLKGMACSLAAAAFVVSAFSSSAVQAKSYPPRTLDFVAPGGAGGGWDLTIRTTAKVLKDTGIVKANMPITNRPGGGGGVNLAFMQAKANSDKMLSVYSSPLLLIKLNGSSQYGYKNTTPIARLLTDYGVFVVPANSRFKSISEVMEALKKDPKSVKIGGNSSAGSMDHIQFLMVAKAAGVKNIKDIDYISFQDGTATAQILGGHVDLLSTGLGDVQQLVANGNLKALAQTASKRVGEGSIASIPTVREQGIDVVFENWRGIFATPGMPSYAVDYWTDAFARMVKTEQWQQALKKNGWDDAYQNAEDFKVFLDKVNEDYKTILAEIGMLRES